MPGRGLSVGSAVNGRGFRSLPGTTSCRGFPEHFILQAAVLACQVVGAVGVVWCPPLPFSSWRASGFQAISSPEPRLSSRVGFGICGLGKVGQRNLRTRECDCQRMWLLSSHERYVFTLRAGDSMASPWSRIDSVEGALFHCPSGWWPSRHGFGTPHAHHLDEDGVERAVPGAALGAGPAVWGPAPEPESFEAIAARSLAGFWMHRVCGCIAPISSTRSPTPPGGPACYRISRLVDGDWWPPQAARNLKHPTHTTTPTAAII